jgi:hypothetical protein
VLKGFWNFWGVFRESFKEKHKKNRTKGLKKLEKV